ncbi:lytic transglycosylase domain-containing protein [Eisenibacter elegans]|jgi:LysM repeat protein|uniref:lytic transglycosylase domain-containing protein n=1 Tax=Eisenibacter elegans TaxID=997 RepID=UPI000401FF3E|nr:lytic transglycosylase domain-containing protein [Eisenibacter elegans]
MLKNNCFWFYCCLLSIGFSNSLSAQTPQVPRQYVIGAHTVSIDANTAASAQRYLQQWTQDPAAWRAYKTKLLPYMRLAAEVLQDQKVPKELVYAALVNRSLQEPTLKLWFVNFSRNLEIRYVQNLFIDETLNPALTSYHAAEYFNKNHKISTNWWYTLYSYFSGSVAMIQHLKANPSPPPGSTIQAHSNSDELAQYWAWRTALEADIAQPGKDESYSLVPYWVNDETLESVAIRLKVPYVQVRELNSWVKEEIYILQNQPVLVRIWAQSPTGEEENARLAAQALQRPEMSLADASNEAVNIVYAAAIEGNRAYTADYSTYYVLGAANTGSFGSANARQHTVSRGESLFAISRQYSISVNDLRTWNRLRTDNLSIGQRLFIENPNPTSSNNNNSSNNSNNNNSGNNQATRPEDNRQTQNQTQNQTGARQHVVQRGESLFAISRQYNTTVDALVAANRLGSMALSVGQVLILPANASSGQQQSSGGNNSSNNNGSNGGTYQRNPVIDRSVQPIAAAAGAPTVSQSLSLADIRLELSPLTRNRVQQDVNAFYRSQRFLQEKIARANQHLFIVEEVLAGEDVPNVFRLLPIQESDFNATAVSSSKAVGYWQFKEPAAREFGLLINAQVDERMNIIASSRAACQYLKRSHSFSNNWVFALLSYNMGFTGARNYFAQQYPDLPFDQTPSRLLLDDEAHWYLVKFLAHMVAFDHLLNQNASPIRIQNYTQGNRKTLQQIAREQNVNANTLKDFNKWLKASTIPNDKTYHVALPMAR